MIFLMVNIPTLLTALSIYFKSDLIYTLPIFYTFLLIPSLDLVYGNFKMKRKDTKSVTRSSDFYLYLSVLMYLMTFFYACYDILQTQYLTIFTILNVGLCSGVIGINTAHELGHRRSAWDRVLANFLLFLSSYCQFYVDHNKGHHKKVATPNDPASARRNEVLYLFWIRSITHTFLSAFKLDKKFMLNYLALHILFIILVATISKHVLLLYVGQSLFSILLLETVNYIEHYGLTRQINPNTKRYEKVTPQHSWNSNHLFSNAHLFNLSYHSDHHANASKPFYELQSIKHAPQMPTGYAGMMLIALVPPLWRKIMHPLLDYYNQSKITE